MKATFSTGVYTIDTSSHVDGLCNGPGDDGDLWIWIRPALRGKARLECVIHEALHAEYPALTEEEVERGAAHIADLVWRMKYRIK